MTATINTALTLASGLTFPNRLVKAAMTEGLADSRNRVTEAHVTLYRRWAEGGVIRVTDLDDNNSYLCAPEKAARETDFYRIDHPDIPRDEVPPLVFETLLGHLEVDFRTFVM